MKKKKPIIVDTKLSLIDYCAASKAIADGFFDDGEYSPYYGKIRAFGTFYNYCVKTPIAGNLEATGDSLEIVGNLMANEILLCEFEKAICDARSFTFGDAYQCAMDIVTAKTNSLNGLSDIVSKAIDKILDLAEKGFGGLDTEAISGMAKQIFNGKLNENDIAKAALNVIRKGEVPKEG